MNDALLPYLQSLRTSVSMCSSAAKTNPELALRCASISGDLLDRMVVDRGIGVTFRAECFVAMSALLPAIEQVLGTPAQATIRELKTMREAANADTFDRFQKLAGELRRSLISAGTPQSAVLRKSIVKIEADYTQKFDQARRAQCAQSAAAGKIISGARNVRTIDEKALLEFIRSKYPQETSLGIHACDFILGGFSKFTVLITLSNAKALPGQIILRGDAGASYGGASVVDEYQLFKVLHAQGVRIPEPYALEESGKVFGSPFMLVEKKPGTAMGHMFDLPAQKNKSLLEDVAANLVKIHQIPLAVIGDTVESATIRSSEKAIQWIDDAEGKWMPLEMPSAVFETAFEWLRGNAKLNDQAPRRLVHGDYSLHNFLLLDGKVSAILDWEYAHIGNPAYDLGYFYPMAKSLSSWEDFLQAYGRAGMPIPDEDQLKYNILFATTRLGVMVCQAVKAFRMGLETGMAATTSSSGGYYEETIIRISDALDRVM